MSAAKYRNGIRGQGGYYDFMTKYVQPYTKGISAKFGRASYGVTGIKMDGKDVLNHIYIVLVLLKN